MHKLIVGTTLSGKTTIARLLASAYSDAGRLVIVLDELLDPAWVTEGKAVFLTDNPEDFKEVFWTNRNLAVFIDEAGESVGRYDKSMSMTATRGRHWGHICHYISQRPSMLARNVRGQCSEVYAFACSKADAEMLAEEFLQPALLKCPDLARGEYIHAMRFGKTNKPEYTIGKLF